MANIPVAYWSQIIYNFCDEVNEMCRPDYLTQIEERITDASVGEAFIPSDFLDIADTTVVRKALSRLSESGKIRRVIRGVYDHPRFSDLLQEYEAPNMEQVAKAIARNFGWNIVPCGDTALNLLGLSTQVPAVWQYVSDGPYREYIVGNRVLKFKHTSNKDLTGQSYITALITQALKALGKDGVNEKVIQKLRKKVAADKNMPDLLAETQHGTVWIFEVMKLITEKGDEA